MQTCNVSAPVTIYVFIVETRLKPNLQVEINHTFCNLHTLD